VKDRHSAAGIPERGKVVREVGHLAESKHLVLHAAVLVTQWLTPHALYRNPSTRTMSPSECSIPENRKVWPSGERLGPQRANK